MNPLSGIQRWAERMENSTVWATVVVALAVVLVGTGAFAKWVLVDLGGMSYATFQENALTYTFRFLIGIAVFLAVTLPVAWLSLVGWIKPRRFGQVLEDHGFTDDEGEAVSYRVLNSPEVGEASADNPFRVAVEKSSSVTLSKLEREEFYTQVRGVRRLIGIEDDGSHWVLKLADTESDLPELLTPEDLPEPSSVSATPVGIDELGEIHEIDFGVFPNLMIAGGSGSGKSVLGNYLVDSWSSRGYELTAIDPHDQFGAFDDRFIERSITPDHERGKSWTKLLREEVDEMHARAAGESEKTPRVLIVDEWPAVLDEEVDHEDLVRKLVQESRKQVMTVCLIMQNPSADILSTTIRDNLGWKLVGRLDNPAMVTNLFPGRDDVTDTIARIDEPGRFMLATDEDIRVVRTPYSERFDQEDEGW